MLKHIDPLLNADLLYALQSMGHGDKLALVDANFPAKSKCKHTLVTMNGIDCTAILKSILKHLPLDDFSATPIEIMAADNSTQPTEAALDFIKTIKKSDESRHQYSLIERFNFYNTVNSCQLVISTNDLRPYACIILQKGIISD
ncbi:MAG: RbsD/FucU domain-containing protein [Photobacterium frigidiphilum]|uniref:RbsD/FucU family protein n=1 Tax=Photobacterium frigidiphilum TaxID=264736 RepID=UPI0030029602